MSEPAGTERERCLEAARDTVMHRGALYRPPLPFFQKLAKRWSLVLGVEVTARQVLLCLIDLKTERATGAPHPDTVIDIAGYAACLEAFDARLPEIAAAMRDRDFCVITADHGNDPTWRGFDHTREHVPILAFGGDVAPGPIGRRNTLADIAETIAGRLGLIGGAHGRSWTS